MKRRHLYFGLGVVASIIVVVGLVVSSRANRSHPTDRRFDVNKWLFATIRGADRVALYEGLPHPMFEGGVEDERRLKPTVDLHGYPFYAQPLGLADADRAVLTEVLGTEQSFSPLPEGLVKGCGGFHPDYAVEWAVGDRVYHCLICYGCGEVKVFGPGGELHCNVLDPDRLKQLLKPYWKIRPASDHWPHQARDVPRHPGT